MTFEILQTKLKDQTWIDTQDPDFIKALTRIENTLQQMGSQIYIFINYFEQYVTAIQNSPIFALGDGSASDGSISSPTQTPAEPANRAERRAKNKAQGADNA